jgi:hypothetical protein
LNVRPNCPSTSRAAQKRKTNSLKASPTGTFFGPYLLQFSHGGKGAGQAAPTQLCPTQL